MSYSQRTERSDKQPLLSHTGELLGPPSGEKSIQEHVRSANTEDPITISEADQAKKLSVPSTVFFIVTGVMLTLPLPQAFQQAGLKSGIMIMCAIAFCVSYQAVALGRCWLILQERWPEKYGHNVLVRRPYPSIALEATGKRWLFYLCEVGIDVTNFGVGLVDLLICAQSLQCTLLPKVPLNINEWLVIVTVVMWPLVLLGAPMESWVVGWIGGFGCLFASFMLIVALAVAAGGGAVISSDPIVGAGAYLVDAASNVTNITTTTGLCASQTSYSDTISFESFGVGFSTLLFAFAGLSLFPTFQHDMKEPKKFWKAALSAYAMICSISIVTAILGYTTYRGYTRSNVLDNIVHPHSAKDLAMLTSSVFVLVYIANGVVAFIPVTADIEEVFKLSKKFTWKHFLIRSVILWAAFGLAAVRPQFQNYIPLVGSTAIALNNFVFPAGFHLLLNGKNLSLHEKVLNYEILIIGVMGIVAGTYASILNIVQS